MNKNNNAKLALLAGFLLVGLMMALPPAGAAVCSPTAVADVDDADADCDAVSNVADNCPFTANAPFGNATVGNDTDDDGVGDACEFSRRVDRDGDGVPNVSDNCRMVVNARQQNFDADAMGDACDTDDDADRRADARDNCLLWYNPAQVNTDGDAFGDSCDSDDDGDATADASDECPTVAGVTDINLTAQAPCTVLAKNRDFDSDGVANAQDTCRRVYNPDQADYDADRLGDVCDADVDNDGIPNLRRGVYDLDNATALPRLVA